MARNLVECTDFRRFGDCRHGRNCYNFHGNHFGGGVSVGEILSVTHSTMTIDCAGNPKELCLSQQDYWSSRGANRSENVIFQESRCRDDRGLCFGRVVMVIEGGLSHRTFPLTDGRIINDAFTIDEIGTRVFDDALSIQDCNEHPDGCKEIGIHIIASALCSKDKFYDLPVFGEKIMRRYPSSRDFFAFHRNKPAPAISVYIHTEGGQVSEPIFTVVSIRESYTFQNARKNVANFELLRETFLTVPNGINSMLPFKYLCGNPDKCETALIVEYIGHAYKNAIKRWVRLKSGAVLITAKRDAHPVKSDDIIMCESDLGRLNDYILSPTVSGDTAHLITSAMKGHEHSLAFLDEYPSNLKWRRQVERGNNINDDTMVVCTSPIRELFHFINQQTLLHSMMPESPVLYDEADLLGILCLRYSTPLLAKSVVGKLADSEFNVDYLPTRGLPRPMVKILYNDLGGNVQSSENERGEREVLIRWENLKCEEPIWEKVVWINKEKFCDAARKKELESTAQYVESETTCPFIPGDDVQLCLKPWVVIHLQIGLKEAQLYHGLGLRLLKIGPNCHVCFIHINHPGQAFTSAREDLQRFVCKPRIDSLKAAIVKRKIHEMTLADVTWHGEYNGGGSFVSDDEVACGDFLCIRKDLEEYVWNAHAVVTNYDAESGIVSFSVCTLFQTERIWNGKYDDAICVIEVIKVAS